MKCEFCQQSVDLLDRLQERCTLEARLNKELLEASENNAALANKVPRHTHGSICAVAQLEVLIEGLQTTECSVARRS